VDTKPAQLTTPAQMEQLPATRCAAAAPRALSTIFLPDLLVNTADDAIAKSHTSTFGLTQNITLNSIPLLRDRGGRRIGH
jgi:hypothetical protein